jgi:two-component system phosphate regulon sensor histidine kinase PhoR
MTQALREELRKVAWRALLGGALGYLFDHFAWGLVAALGFYLINNLRQLAALRTWLENPKQNELPAVSGIWGEVFDDLLELQRRNKKRKKRLAAMLAEFRASTAALPDAAVVLTPRGEIAWYNSAADALLGLRNQDIGTRVVNLIRQPVFTDYFNKGHYDGEVEVPSGEDTVLSYRIIPYGAGQRLLLARDISDRKRLEHMRRDFVANASHELRTPLTVLRGYLDLMQLDEPMSIWHAPIQEMHKQAVRMESVINDLLKLARLEADTHNAPFHPIDIESLISKLLNDAEAMSSGKHRIRAHIEAGVGLQGREVDVQSIFANLLFNAVHYTPAGGEISVRWWQDEHGLHYAVTDTGLGIPEKDLPRLTERFYRVDVGRSRASGGTGLGLSIVKHALERHEGRLSIVSQVGKGSTFTAHFPTARVWVG